MQKIMTCRTRLRSLAGLFAAALIFAATAITGTADAEPAPAKPSPFAIGAPAQPAAEAAPANAANAANADDSGAAADAATAKPAAGPVPMTGAAGRRPDVASASFGQRVWGWVLEMQSRLNRDMAAAVRKMKSDNPIAATLSLIAIAFGYGVLHAVGPGHGKAVISSYVLANEQTVRRGIALSFLSALFQALSAILFVGVLAIVLRQTSLQMRSTEAVVETLSWALVAAVGATLLWRQTRAYLKERQFALAHPGVPSARGHSHAASDPHHQHAHAHAHAHTHGPDCGCGHAHMPSPHDLQGPWSWRTALPLALSVGIRPCSGALLLLIFTLSQGLIWAGILGTFAMALGTAITVSILAALAVSSRNWAEKMSGQGSPWAARIHTAAGFAGAALVFLLGTTLFFASLSSTGPF
ncbi:MAG: nickel/cobalt transporter [Hyphomicrobium sp.]